MPIVNDSTNKNRTPLVLEKNRRCDLLVFFSGCDIAHSSSQLLPEAVSVAACGCLTTVWKESWHHFVEGISQTEGVWLPNQLVNTVASLLD